LGRIISEADIEAQLAPNNLMSSHSLAVWIRSVLPMGPCSPPSSSARIGIVQLGVSAGNDVTPWETQDPGTQPTGSIMVQWQSTDGHWGFYGGDNAFNNAHWGF
jgi:hypothetical protein